MRRMRGDMAGRMRGLTFEVTRDRQRSARAARPMIVLGGLAALARSWWASR